jgi:hypothetical protein
MAESEPTARRAAKKNGPAQIRTATSNICFYIQVYTQCASHYTTGPGVDKLLFFGPMTWCRETLKSLLHTSRAFAASHSVSPEFSILEPTRHFLNPLEDTRIHSTAPLRFFPAVHREFFCLKMSRCVIEALDSLDGTRSFSFSTRLVVCLTG